jgi:hypothetical protein
MAVGTFVKHCDRSVLATMYAAATRLYGIGDGIVMSRPAEEPAIQWSVVLQRVFVTLL